MSNWKQSRRKPSLGLLFVSLSLFFVPSVFSKEASQEIKRAEYQAKGASLAKDYPEASLAYQRAYELSKEPSYLLQAAYCEVMVFQFVKAKTLVTHYLQNAPKETKEREHGMLLLSRIEAAILANQNIETASSEEEVSAPPKTEKRLFLEKDANRILPLKPNVTGVGNMDTTPKNTPLDFIPAYDRILTLEPNLTGVGNIDTTPKNTPLDFTPAYDRILTLEPNLTGVGNVDTTPEGKSSTPKEKVTPKGEPWVEDEPVLPTPKTEKKK